MFDTRIQRNLCYLGIVLIIYYLSACASTTPQPDNNRTSISGNDIVESTVTIYIAETLTGAISASEDSSTLELRQSVIDHLKIIDAAIAPQYNSDGQARWSTLEEGYVHANNGIQLNVEDTRSNGLLYISAPAGVGKSMVFRPIAKRLESHYLDIVTIELRDLFHAYHQLEQRNLVDVPDLEIYSATTATTKPLNTLRGLEPDARRELLASKAARRKFLDAVLSLPENDNIIDHTKGNASSGKLVVFDSIDEIDQETATILLISAIESLKRESVGNQTYIVLGRGEVIANARPYIEGLSGPRVAVRTIQLKSPTPINRAELETIVKDLYQWEPQLFPQNEATDFNKLIDILESWMINSPEIRASFQSRQFANWIIGYAANEAAGIGDYSDDLWGMCKNMILSRQLARGERSHSRPEQDDPLYIAAMHAASMYYANDALENKGSFRVALQRKIRFKFGNGVYVVDPEKLLDRSGFIRRDPLHIDEARYEYFPSWMMRAWIESDPPSDTM